MSIYNNYTGIKEQLVYLSRHNKILDYELNKIRRYDSLSEGERLRLAEQKAYDLARYAKRNTEFYGKLYKEFPLKDPGEFLSLPVIRKQDVLSNKNSMRTTAAVFLIEGKTSGTSGTPLSVLRSPASVIRENAYIWHYRMSHGLNVGDPVVSMRGKLLGDKLHYYNRAENVLYLSIYLLSANNISKYAKLIRDFQPTACLALPSSMYTMVNLLTEEAVDVNIPIVFTSSSTLYPFQREKIEKTVKGRIFDWYGNAERTIALGQCDFGNYHEPPLYSLNYFTDDGIITTSLTNKSFPMIKYLVDDHMTQLNGRCACGRAGGVKSIEGRFEDAVVLADGRMVNGLGIAFKGIRHLQYAQIVQDEVNKLVVNLVTVNGFSGEDEKVILKRLRQRLNDSVQITFRQVGEQDIVKTSAGKFTLIISKLDFARLPDHLRTFERRHKADAAI